MCLHDVLNTDAAGSENPEESAIIVSLLSQWSEGVVNREDCLCHYRSRSIDVRRALQEQNTSVDFLLREEVKFVGSVNHPQQRVLSSTLELRSSFTSSSTPMMHRDQTTSITAGRPLSSTPRACSPRISS